MFFLCPVVNVHQGVNVGQVFAETLSELQMTQQQASITCGYKDTDRSGLSRAIAGEQPLDLWRLRNLGLDFWQAFLPKLASALIKTWFIETHGDYRMARASLRERESERKVS